LQCVATAEMALMVCIQKLLNLESQPRHRLGPHQGDLQRKQQNGPVDQGSDTLEKNKTSRWTETRSQTNFHTSMTTYCPPQLHLADSRSS